MEPKENDLYRVFMDPLSPASSQLTPDSSKLVQEVDSLRDLGIGWDGYDAGPIRADLIAAARDFARSIRSVAIRDPSVVPLPDGRLQFEWHNKSRSLEILFEEPDLVHYFKCDRAQPAEEEQTIARNETPALVALLKWFAEGENDNVAGARPPRR